MDSEHELVRELTELDIATELAERDMLLCEQQADEAKARLRDAREDFETLSLEARSKRRELMQLRRREAERYYRRITYNTNRDQSSIPRDEYVLAEPIARVVERWIDIYEAEVGENTGARLVLSHRSGVNVRTIYDMLARRRETVTYDTAERLLIVIDREDVLQDLEILPPWQKRRDRQPPRNGEATGSPESNGSAAVA